MMRVKQVSYDGTWFLRGNHTSLKMADGGTISRMFRGSREYEITIREGRCVEMGSCPRDDSPPTLTRGAISSYGGIDVRVSTECGIGLGSWSPHGCSVSKIRVDECGEVYHRDQKYLLATPYPEWLAMCLESITQDLPV